MSKNLTILGNRLLIEPMIDEQKGDIIVPEIAAGKKWLRNTGRLCAFGKKVHDTYPGLKKGDIIIHNPYGEKNQEIELNQKTYLLIDVSAVHGVGVIE